MQEEYTDGGVIDSRAPIEYATSIPEYLDDMDLSPAAFRLYVHYKRAADDKSKSFSLSLRALASHCQLSTRKVRDARQELVAVGLLDQLPSRSEDEIVRLLRRKIPQDIAEDAGHVHACSWCKGRTFVLHNHHYPIPKHEGGTKTVAICANCHVEFHALTEPQYQLTSLGMGED